MNSWDQNRVSMACTRSGWQDHGYERATWIDPVGDVMKGVSKLGCLVMALALAGCAANLPKAAISGDVATIAKVPAAEINARYEEGRTLLLLAIEAGQLEVVKALIAQGAGLEEKDAYGHTPLGYAARHGNLVIAKALVEAGAAVEGGVSGYTPLILAFSWGHHGIGTYLAEQGADVFAREDKGDTALHNIIRATGIADRAGSAQALLGYISKKYKGKLKGFVDAPGEGGLTALHWAANADHPEMVEIVALLIAAGADPWIRSVKGQTPLLFASLRKKHTRRAEIAAKLLSAPALDNATQREAYINDAPKGGLTALRAANLVDDLPLMEVLLANGADADETMTTGHGPHYTGTLLLSAATKGNVQKAELLLRHGADVNKSRNVAPGHWNTPLYAASSDGNYALVKVLLDAGAKPNGPASFSDGTITTPLHAAASLGHADVLQLLIQRGGNADEKDSTGWTAQDYRNSHNREVAERRVEQARIARQQEELARQEREDDEERSRENAAIFRDLLVGTAEVLGNAYDEQNARKAELARLQAAANAENQRKADEGQAAIDEERRLDRETGAADARAAQQMAEYQRDAERQAREAKEADERQARQPSRANEKKDYGPAKAWCKQSKANNFTCMGPTQKMWSGEKSLAYALDLVGCKGGQGNVPVAGGSGELFECWRRLTSTELVMPIENPY